MMTIANHTSKGEFVGLTALKASALFLSLTLFVGVAAAQPPSWPIVHGRQLQPTQQQLEGTSDRNATEWTRWNNRVQPDVDRLYDEIIHATTQP
jgi:hypothetical protein